MSRKAAPSATRNECGSSRRLTVPGAARARATTGIRRSASSKPRKPAAATGSHGTPGSLNALPGLQLPMPVVVAVLVSLSLVGIDLTVLSVFGGALGTPRELPYTIADTSPLASAPSARSASDTYDPGTAPPASSSPRCATGPASPRRAARCSPAAAAWPTSPECCRRRGGQLGDGVDGARQLRARFLQRRRTTRAHRDVGALLGQRR